MTGKLREVVFKGELAALMIKHDVTLERHIDTEDYDGQQVDVVTYCFYNADGICIELDELWEELQ